VNGFTEKQRAEKTRAIESRLFEFANFLEARIVLLYIEGENEVRTKSIIKRAYAFQKIVVLPAFDSGRFKVTTLKSIIRTGSAAGAPRVAQPNPARLQTRPPSENRHRHHSRSGF